jgi:AraC-like DNA-binding protein
VQAKDNIEYQRILPDNSLSDFVKCFWHLNNYTTEEKIVTIFPDGYFDILFFSINNAPFIFSLSGLGTKPIEYIIPKNATTFAISFKLLAAEYILNTNISSLVNKGKYLPNNFWGFEPSDLCDFKSFVNKVTKKMIEIVNKNIDHRKQHLFDILYVSNGALTVGEISDTVHWSRRQINRYFKNRFGISLKAYCSILRYRASFEHIKDGQLYPEEKYADQAHFIKEVKKYSGVTPKQLAANKNDRFIQFSTLPKK